eukprot:320895-Rhodomonas_salina.1
MSGTDVGRLLPGVPRCRGQHSARFPPGTSLLRCLPTRAVCDARYCDRRRPMLGTELVRYWASTALCDATAMRGTEIAPWYAMRGTELAYGVPDKAVGRRPQDEPGAPPYAIPPPHTA